ncbi:Organic solvent ABC transporter substrate-binding protein [Flavobacterium sp. 9AF]|uniref:MlaD family protein n=1 Tax=Flavobacterium sp. 9AF TaxID=2653142 RepID=UPI0012EF8F6B|nr:MlaD family protein [Flavobacterium sp. 9AF]VXC41159.1 Organic solvent ABC transporter substrate-binding protein [Flavobacterium sp. 9AF]
MESNNTYKIKLGLFVSLGLLFLFFIIFLIGSQQNLFSSQIKLTTKFKNASGLQVGSKVRFSGIDVGTVDNIEIVNDSTVQVDLLINSDVKQFIKKNSKASIGSEGVIGDKLLTISQGSATAKEIKNGDVIRSFEPVEMDDILASVKVTAENAEIISDELAILLGDINDGEGTLGKLMNDESMAQDLEKTMENLRKSSKGLNENMEAAKHNFLLRGYFRKKEREKRKALEKAQQEAEERQEENKNK